MPSSSLAASVSGCCCCCGHQSSCREFHRHTRPVLHEHVSLQHFTTANTSLQRSSSTLNGSWGVLLVNDQHARPNPRRASCCGQRHQHQLASTKRRREPRAPNFFWSATPSCRSPQTSLVPLTILRTVPQQREGTLSKPAGRRGVAKWPRP